MYISKHVSDMNMYRLGNASVGCLYIFKFTVILR